VKIKKGEVWLRMEFEAQLRAALKENHVVDLNTLPDFPGRDIVIKNMLLRDELDQATESDIAIQEEIDRVRQEKKMEEERRRKELEAEEEELLQLIAR